jgi:putative pre-16S rRNA nuclease
MSRLLGIDHGRRRIGIAVADSETRVAFARPAVLRAGAAGVAAVVALARDEGVDLVVVGLPRNMDGSEGPQAAVARAFGEALVGTGLPVTYVDERLTSWEAGQRLGSAAHRPSRASGELDSAAARLILQDYLDAGTAGPDGPLPSTGERHHQEIG